MPNEPGVRNVDWNTYLTTVDAIEALTRLRPAGAAAGRGRSGRRERHAAAARGRWRAPPALNEGDSRDLQCRRIDRSEWLHRFRRVELRRWRDGIGRSASHVFAQDGVYAVTVTVTDNDGLTDTATPQCHGGQRGACAGRLRRISLETGDAYTVDGTFSDPGADSLDRDGGLGRWFVAQPGHAQRPEFLAGACLRDAGSFTVTVTVADDDTSTSTAHTVTVTQPPAPGPDLSQAHALIDQLVANRKISRDFGNLMKSQVSAAQSYISQGKNGQAVSVLKVVLLELDLLVQFRQITAADAAPLRTLITQVIAQLSTQPSGTQKYPGYKLFKVHNSCKSHQRPRSSSHQSLRIHRFR